MINSVSLEKDISSKYNYLSDICFASPENLPLGFPTRSNTNGAVQQNKNGYKLVISEEVEIVQCI